MHQGSELKYLHELSELMGLQIQYKSSFGNNPVASIEAQIAVLKALGLELKENLSNLQPLLKFQRNRENARMLQPVNVVYASKGGSKVRLRLPSDFKPARAEVTIEQENGDISSFVQDLGKLKPAGPRIFNGYSERVLPLGRALEMGYHSLSVRMRGHMLKSTIICAPAEAYQIPGLRAGKKFGGLFAPTYALQSRSSWGIGDVSDLKRLIEIAYESGCDFVGTLPMLALFLDKPVFEFSPYSPASRLFWNEIFLDISSLSDFQASKRAQALFNSTVFQDELRALNASRWVDYKRVYALKKRVLRILADEFFSKGGERDSEFKSFCQERPLVKLYAKFRATLDEQRAEWQAWPEHLRAGRIKDRDYNEHARRFHLYAQWMLQKQLSRLAEESGRDGLGIYLDFPLSVHPASFDVWHERDSFALLATAGCPPDVVHTQGQNWGILPLHPYGIRESSYRYLRACLSNIMSYCGLLRLDHIMSLYRLYWVPQGMSAKDGVYVRYNSDELFAILSLESRRNRCILIGEDLGTVPDEIRSKMAKHGFLRMYVQQRNIRPDSRDPIEQEPENCIASMNTHDMPPHAAAWRFLDLKDQVKLKVRTKTQCNQKIQALRKAQRAALKWLHKKRFLPKGSRNPKRIMQAFALKLARGPARLFIMNIEDLWLELIRQNTPATSRERPNWQHKLKYSLEQIAQNKEALAFLRKLAAYRRR